MNTSGRQDWFRAAFLAGAAYFLIGKGATLPANQHVWRLAAWIMSAAVYAVHIWFEHFRRRNAPRLVAWHVAVAVAIGAFGLAAAAMIHSLSAASGTPAGLRLALVVWPVLIGAPAFLVALVIAATLGRFSGSMEAT